MRIAILEPYIDGIGGAQRVIADYAVYLQKRGHEVEIFTQRYNKETAYPTFKKLKINILKPKIKAFIPLIFLFKKFHGFDRLIANDWPSNFSSIRNRNIIWICYTPKRDFYDLARYNFKRASFKEKFKLIIKKSLFKKLDKLSAKKALKILVASKNVAQRVKKYYKRNAKVINHGINLSKYKQKEGENYFLCVSRFVAPKRVELAITSMGFTKNKKVKLYVVGDGSEREKIRKLCYGYENVKFLGKVSERRLIDLYSQCLGFIYTPIDEDWGLGPIEASASGKPVIGVNEGGLKETIVDGKTGFLLKNISAAKIAEKIDYLTDKPNIGRKMGEEGKKYVQRFDWNILLPRLEKEILNSQN